MVAVEAGSDTGWEADRVAAVLQQYVLPPGEQIVKRTDWPTEVILSGVDHDVVAGRARWLIGREPWVRYAVRAVEDLAYIPNTSVTHGFVFPRAGDTVLYLNDAATMRQVGARVGVDLDPIAYAEVLAELYSGPRTDRPVVRPTSATPEYRAAELIRDVADFHSRYEFVDPALLAPPAVRRVGDQVVLEFCSGHYYITGLRALDLLRWSVTCGGGRPASWQREYIVQRLESA